MNFKLRCTTCKSVEENISTQNCPRCKGMLECIYPKEALGCLKERSTERGLSRFSELLPVEAKFRTCLGEGDTPLLESKYLAEKLGLRKLFLKNEALNPTGSFKDRGISVSIGMALSTGAEGALTVSSGNAAASLAAYAAASQLPCLVLVDSTASESKIQQILFMGAKCLRVEGIFARGPQPLLEMMERLTRALNFWCAFTWAPVNPYSLEGTKTIAYECAKISPDVVVCPVAGGDNLAGQWKGYTELHTAGLIAKKPRLIGVQPKGSSPLVQAYLKCNDTVESITEAKTRISSLKTTFSGNHALNAIYQSAGYAIEVGDGDTLRQQKRLAEYEGIWVEPASAITVAALPELLKSGKIDSNETVLCILTGAGFKEPVHSAVDSKSKIARFDPDDIIEIYVKDFARSGFEKRIHKEHHKEE